MIRSRLAADIDRLALVNSTYLHQAHEANGRDGYVIVGLAGILRA